jgi:uncharacterized protein YegP (UPF0339 family)
MPDADPYLHMDDQWMWRFYFLDRFGNLIVMSTQAYFTRAEAEEAMLLFRSELCAMAA